MTAAKLQAKKTAFRKAVFRERWLGQRSASSWDALVSGHSTDRIGCHQGPTVWFPGKESIGGTKIGDKRSNPAPVRSSSCFSV